MKAIESLRRREPTPLEWREIDREIRAAMESYVQAAVRLTSLCMPIITATRDAESQQFVVSSSYPQEVEACLAQYRVWCDEAVTQVRRRWGLD